MPSGPGIPPGDSSGTIIDHEAPIEFNEVMTPAPPAKDLAADEEDIDPKPV